MMDAAHRLKLAAAPEGIEARAEAMVASLASLNARGMQVSLAMFDAAIDKYLEIASDKLMQEDALSRLGEVASRGITAETLRSRFWNNLSGLIARRHLVVLGKRSAKKKN